MSSPKHSKDKALWVIYNAWKVGSAGVDEAAVEDEAAITARALEELGCTPEMYAIASVADFAVRINGAGRPRLVLNLAEGFRGDTGKEGLVAALFELLDLPYTGNSAKTLTLAQDKILTKRLLAQAGIPTPGWAVFSGAEDPVLDELAFPLIAKPSREDASLGISSRGVFSSAAEVQKTCRELFATYKQPILIEEFIDGREINAAILENAGRPRVLPLSEILFDGIPPGVPRITSYEAKWNKESVLYTKTPAQCPAAVEPSLRARIEEIACAVFHLLEGKDYGRVDFRVDASGKPWVLEYNPNPDISQDGGFARSLAADGLSFAGFIRILLQNNGYAL